MTRRLLVAAFLILLPAFAHAQSTMQIAVVGKSTVANTAAYGTVVDSLFATSADKVIHGVTWAVSNPNFYVDPGGALHSAWQSIIAPGPQTMTLTASAAGYTNATTSLTVTVTGTLTSQTMVITPTPVATVYDNSPQNTIAYQLVVSQTNGTLGNLGNGVTWTSDNPLFSVIVPNTNSGTYYVVTTWTGMIAAGSQTVDLTASAPGYTTTTITLTISVVPVANPTMTIAVNGSSSVAENAVAGAVVDTLSATDPNGNVISGVTFSVNNSNFSVSGGNLTTAWLNPLSPGSQTMTITATAAGFQTATLPLTVTIGPPCH